MEDEEVELGAVYAHQFTHRLILVLETDPAWAPKLSGTTYRCLVLDEGLDSFQRAGKVISLMISALPYEKVVRFEDGLL